MAQSYTVPIPVAGDSPASRVVLRPATTFSDRAPSSPLSPSIPVRNQTQTPPGSAVSQAPPADHFSAPPSARASRRPVLAVYSSTTAPPAVSCAAVAYRVAASGLTARPESSRPDGRTARGSTARVRADTRSSVRPAPAHTDPAGPAAGAGGSFPGTDRERTVASVRGLTSSSIEGRPAASCP